MKLEDMINTIQLGDCLEVMKNISNDSIDVTFTSPPYNSEKRKIHDTTKLKKRDYHRKYLEEERSEDWYEWQCECINEMLRVTKKYVLYNIQPLYTNKHNVYKLIGKYSDIIHSILIWYKPNGCHTSTPHKISNYYEFILILKCNRVDNVDVNSISFKNVIIENINSNNEYSEIHGAVMNKNVCYKIIKEFSNENDIILDPFSGMGTTCLVAKELNRRYIGIELNKTYYEYSKRRLNGISYNGQISLMINESGEILNEL